LPPLKESATPEAQAACASESGPSKPAAAAPAAGAAQAMHAVAAAASADGCTAVEAGAGSTAVGDAATAFTTAPSCMAHALRHLQATCGVQQLQTFA
jgi:hypothetical protein